MRGMMKKVAVERAKGNRPSPPKAVVFATAVGAVVGGVTYRVLRS